VTIQVSRFRSVYADVFLWLAIVSGSALSAEVQFVESINRTNIELGNNLDVELFGLEDGRTCAVKVLYGDGQSARSVVSGKDSPTDRPR
jgi:hypothetical protein